MIDQKTGNVKGSQVLTEKDRLYSLSSAPQRPDVPLLYACTIPPSLRELPQWVLWRYLLNKDGDRWTKVLHYHQWVGEHKDRQTLLYHKGNSKYPKSWMPYEFAAMHVQLCQDFGVFTWGLGFGLLPGGGIFCIDLDNCRDRTTGAIEPWAQKIIDQLDTYTEVSPSGTGVKIFGYGAKPGIHCKKKLDHGGEIEIYDQERYLTVTGRHLPGTPLDVQFRQDELANCYRSTWPAGEHPHANADVAAEHFGPLPSTNLSDAALIEKASNAKNGFKFDALWRGDISVSENDRSHADYDLAKELAFWCGPDEDRIIRLMRQSGLRRRKWERPKYLPDILRKVLARQTSFYGQGFKSQRQRANEAEVADIADKNFISVCGGKVLGSDGAAAGQLGEAPAPELTLEKAARMRRTREAIDAACKAIDADRKTGKIPDWWQEETDAAATLRKIETDRRDFDAYPCPNTRTVAYRNKITGEQYFGNARCDRRHKCRPCLQRLIRRDLDNALLHFGAAKRKGQKLYAAGCSKAEWDALRKCIHKRRGCSKAEWDALQAQWAALRKRIRKGSGNKAESKAELKRLKKRIGENRGKFMRIVSPDSPNWFHVVIAIDAEELAGQSWIELPDAAAAVETIRIRLERHQGRGRPITASHTWALPKGKPSNLKREGEYPRDCPPIDQEILQKLADMFDCDVVHHHPCDPLRRQYALWSLRKRNGREWTATQREACRAAAADLAWERLGDSIGLGRFERAPGRPPVGPSGGRSIAEDLELVEAAVASESGP